MTINEYQQLAQRTSARRRRTRRRDTVGTLGAGAKNNRRFGGEKMNLNKWVKRCHEIAVAHGWRDEEKSLGECIALMHSENGGLKK